jgi:hypothetical protein
LKEVKIGAEVGESCREHGISEPIPAKKRSQHVTGFSDAHAPKVLQRDFCAIASSQLCATDVTEFKVNGQKLFLLAWTSKKARNTA